MLDIFFSGRETSGFRFLCPRFLIIHFVFTLFFLLLITHFSQESYAHVLLIIPRAAILSQILFLIHEQNGIKTRLNGMCLPSKLNNLEKITGGYLKAVTTKQPCSLVGNAVEWLLLNSTEIPLSFLLLLVEIKLHIRKIIFISPFPFPYYILSILNMIFNTLGLQDIVFLPISNVSEEYLK